jgi:hypothetical protein
MHAMNDEDEWINAVCAVIATTPPDLSPMAALLRGNKPIPPGIRDALAELFDPGEPPRYNVRLTPELIETQNKDVAFYMKWIAVGIYDRLRAEGVSEEDALMEAAKIFPRDKSVVHRARISIHEFIAKLLKRIRHPGGIWSQKLSKKRD